MNDQQDSLDAATPDIVGTTPAPIIPETDQYNKINHWLVYSNYPTRNHEAVAALFAEVHKEAVCYLPALKRWLYYTGKVWAFDNEAATNVKNILIDFNKDVIDVSREYLQAIRRSTPDKEVKYYTDLVKWAAGLNNTPAIDNLLSMLKTKCAASLADFDTNDYLFNVKNGTIDLTTGEKKEHNPGDKITLICDINYNPKARFDRWDSFLLEACWRVEYVRHLQKEAGYSITGLTDEELLFMPYGDPITGKSTFYEPVTKLLGEYSFYMAFNTLKATDKDGGAPREDLLRLRTARWVTCSEVNKNTKFDTALVKKIVSGENIVARGIRARDSVEFEPRFKVWIATNYAPIVPFDDAGTYRRVRVNPFLNIVASDKIDKTLKRRFKTDIAARERILLWLVEGAVHYFNEGLEDIPREIERANNAYLREQSPLYLFIEDYCVEDRYAGKYVTPELCKVEAFVDAFNGARAEYGAEEITAKSFGRYMLALHYKPWRDKKKRGYSGIRLKTVSELDDDIGFYDYQDAFDALLRYVYSPSLVVTYDVYMPILAYISTKNKKYRNLYENTPFKRQTSSVLNVDQQKLAQYFFTIFKQVKSAGLSVANDQDTLLKAASERIQAAHPELSDYDVYAFGQRLAIEDKQAQALLADVITPAVAAYDNNADSYS